jgi:hypothetical protein
MRTRGRTAGRKLSPCLPDDCLKDGIEFFDDPSVAKAVQELESRWQRWYAAKKIIDDDWRRSQASRLEAIADIVDRDRQKILLEEFEAAEAARNHADALVVDDYLERFAALARKQNEEWLVKAKARLDRTTAKINRSILEHERQVFGITSHRDAKHHALRRKRR